MDNPRENKVWQLQTEQSKYRGASLCSSGSGNLKPRLSCEPELAQNTAFTSGLLPQSVASLSLPSTTATLSEQHPATKRQSKKHLLDLHLNPELQWALLSLPHLSLHKTLQRALQPMLLRWEKQLRSRMQSQVPFTRTREAAFISTTCPPCFDSALLPFAELFLVLSYGTPSLPRSWDLLTLHVVQSTATPGFVPEMQP